MLYQLLLCSKVNQLYVYMYLLFFGFPSQSTKQSSLCYTVGSHQLSILYIVSIVHICQSQSPNSSHALSFLLGIHSLFSASVSYAFLTFKKKKRKNGLPWWSGGSESVFQCRGHRFKPWSGKVPHATGQLSPWTTTQSTHWSLGDSTTEALTSQSPCSAVREATVMRSPCSEKPACHKEVQPRLPQLGKAHEQQKPEQPKTNK